jgi:hypothetical protein
MQLVGQVTTSGVKCIQVRKSAVAVAVEGFL